MRKRVVVGAGVIAAAAATWAGIAIAGDDNARDLDGRSVAEPMTATKEGPVTRAGRNGTIQTFYLRDEVVPEEGGDAVVGPRCPRREGEAIGGGAATRQGVDLVYLSQLNPETLESSPRVYYVGVEDVDADPGAGAFVEVHCAKGIAVRK